LSKGAKKGKITLADGIEYQLSPLNLNMMAEVEDKFDISIADIGANPRMRMLRYILWMRLMPNHPELTEEKVGELCDLSILTNNTTQILGV